jgi:hypothetical protein
MRASIYLLSAAALICVAHTAALAQYAAGLKPYRPDLSFPPNWQSGPGGVRAYPRLWQSGPGGVPSGLFGRRGQAGLRGPVRPNIPGIGQGFFGSVSGPGSFSPLPGTTPPEPNVRYILQQMEKANGAAPTPSPGGPAQAPPAVLEPMLNPPMPGFS